jgi:hypothetical protein
MKKKFVKPILTALALISVPSAVLAQTSITITNASFELPGTGKIKTGFSTITGWANAGTTYYDSGVESSPASQDGSWHAYGESGDPGAYQIANYQLQLGDTISLSWYADGTGGSAAKMQTVDLLGAASLGTVFSSCTVLNSRTDTLANGTWSQYTLSYTASAPDVGNYIGVFFANQPTASPNSNNSWSGFDNFSMTVTSVPEPSSLALVGLGMISGLGIVMRRRKV